MAQQDDDSTTPYHANSDPSSVSSQQRTLDCIDEMSFNQFKKAMVAEWQRYLHRRDDCIGEGIEPSNPIDYDAWVHYAARVNPKAAYEFTRIVETMRRIQGRGEKNGSMTSQGLLKMPLKYIVDSYLSVEQDWMLALREWNHSVRLGLPSPDPKTCSLELKNLHSSRLEMQRRLTNLDECLINNCPGEEFDIEPTEAWRAICVLLTKLNELESSLFNCLEDIKIAWGEPTLGGGQEEPSSEQHLRRRRYKNSFLSVPENNEHPAIRSTSRENPKTPKIGKLFPWLQLHLARLLETSIYQAVRIPTRKMLLRNMVKQSTLWKISLTVATVSCVITIVAISKPRAAICRPTPDMVLSDDGFWALLSQTVLSFLAVYCSVVPLLRESNFIVRKSYFLGTAGISVAMSALALAVYGFSWEGSTLCSYIASVTALITSVQLAGGIESTARLP